MLRLLTSRAAPGMVLALPVLHPGKTQHLLLRPGARLDEPLIRRLLELKVPCLFVEHPPTAFLMQYFSPAIIAEHGRLAARLAETLDAVPDGRHTDLEFPAYADAVRSLLGKLLDDPKASVFTDAILDAGHPLAAHSANVCMLSLLMGLKLDEYLIAQRRNVPARRAQNVENLGLGAMLHDVGMLRIDPAAAARWWRNFDESDDAWRRHVLIGFEMVRGKVPATAAAVVLHHHQRLDGSGFPRRAKPLALPRALVGAEIHVFSRIVAVADVFDRVRQKQEAVAGPGGPPAPPVRALRAVLEQVRAGQLDSSAFKALLHVAPAYPPGSVVELNDGRSCVVTRWRPTAPCSPTVRPLLPADARPAGHGLGPEVDLAEHPSFSIVSLDGQKVSDDNFHPLSRDEFDLRTVRPGLTLDEPHSPVRAFPMEGRAGEAA